MAEAGVNIEVLYSDHDHRLILVVNALEKGRAEVIGFIVVKKTTGTTFQIDRR